MASSIFAAQVLLARGSRPVNLVRLAPGHGTLHRAEWTRGEVIRPALTFCARDIAPGNLLHPLPGHGTLPNALRGESSLPALVAYAPPRRLRWPRYRVGDGSEMGLPCGDNASSSAWRFEQWLRGWRFKREQRLITLLNAQSAINIIAAQPPQLLPYPLIPDH